MTQRAPVGDPRLVPSVGLIAAALVLLLGAVPAHAAQTVVSYSLNDGLRITGDSAADGVQVTRSGSIATIGRLGTGNPLAPSGGCSGTSTQVTCTIPSNGARILRFTGGGSNDFLEASEYPDDVVAGGGTGADTLRGGAGFDLLEGGDGGDQLRGNGGNDVLRGNDDRDELRGHAGNDRHEGGAGADVLIDDLGSDTYRGDEDNDDMIVDDAASGADAYVGGPGFDEISYAARVLPVRVRLLNEAIGDGFQGSDIFPAENDVVNPGIEKVVGGSGDDTLAGGEPAGVLVVLQGGPGDDELFGSSVPAVLNGGPGRDRLAGGSGEDTLSAVDGEADEIASCGGSSDFLFADLRDEPFPANCEAFEQGDRREGPNVVFLTRKLRVRENGRARVRLRCPKAVGKLGCKGTLRAASERRKPKFGRRTRYKVAAGKKATVVVRLRKADREALEDAKKPKLRLRSVEKGRHGPKTTQRVLPVR